MIGIQSLSLIKSYSSSPSRLLYQLINTKVIVLIFIMPTDCKNTILITLLGLGRLSRNRIFCGTRGEEWIPPTHVSAWLEFKNNLEEANHRKTFWVRMLWVSTQSLKDGDLRISSQLRDNLIKKPFITYLYNINTILKGFFVFEK